MSLSTPSNLLPKGFSEIVVFLEKATFILVQIVMFHLSSNFSFDKNNECVYNLCAAAHPLFPNNPGFGPATSVFYLLENNFSQ